MSDASATFDRSQHGRDWLAAYYRSAAWKRKRLQQLELDGHRCRLFSSACDGHLEVHHTEDGYAVIPHEEPGFHLLTLCQFHHDVVTDAERRARYSRRGNPEVPDVPAPQLRLVNDRQSVVAVADYPLP